MYKFEIDEESKAFCNQIAACMVLLFGISTTEAVSRINQQWAGLSFVGDDIIYHDTAEDWAKNIYWGLTLAGGFREKNENVGTCLR